MLRRKRKEEEQRRLELKRKEEYAKSKEGRFETAMDYYEGRDGKNMDFVHRLYNVSQISKRRLFASNECSCLHVLQSRRL